MARHYDYNEWRPYVPVGTRRRRAAKEAARLREAGVELAPVVIDGRKIARTFWGASWCTNLECYSDFANRLPRGRTYVRNGSVIHLGIEPGKLHALVSGSEIYEIEIGIKRLAASRWKSLKKRCTGKIGSLVELLRGDLSKEVMEVVTQEKNGLFPAAKEISFRCSCPDWASMCKHVAATLYGVGARIDQSPQMLFRLRGVDPAELLKTALKRPVVATSVPKGRIIAGDDLADVFGVEIEPEPVKRRGAPKRGEKGAKSGKATAKKAKAGTAATKRSRPKSGSSRKRVTAKAAGGAKRATPVRKKPSKTGSKTKKRTKVAKKAVDEEPRARKKPEPKKGRRLRRKDGRKKASSPAKKKAPGTKRTTAPKKEGTRARQRTTR